MRINSSFLEDFQGSSIRLERHVSDVEAVGSIPTPEFIVRVRARYYFCLAHRFFLFFK